MIPATSKRAMTKKASVGPATAAPKEEEEEEREEEEEDESASASATPYSSACTSERSTGVGHSGPAPPSSAVGPGAKPVAHDASAAIVMGTRNFKSVLLVVVAQSNPIQNVVGLIRSI